MATQDKDKISLRDAISIGIGGMVGGGIFAVLGLSVDLTRGGAPAAFLFAGVIALATSYAYARLSLTFPGSGGTVSFINQAFGKNIFSGGLNNLLWVSYIIMLSLYATAFSSYAPNLLSITGNLTADKHIYATLIILIAAGINYYSISVVGKIESYAVLIKLIILVAFTGVGAWGLMGNASVSQLAFSEWKGPIGMITGGMVIFVAYEGFELIANASPNIINPAKNIPRSYYISVGFVIVLYILIAIITVGSLPFSEIARAKDYALAEAAKPMLGQTGFTVITIAALISTFSAINASLYGGSRVSYELALDDEDPHELTKYLWNEPVGLVITTVLTILLVNTVDLENIATSGSVGFLLIFAFVNLAAFKLSGEIKARRIITFIAFLLCLAAMSVLILQQFQTNTVGILIALGIILFCFAGETVF
ncbi:MAG TPA: APC family permease, partial [Bacteroidales bacterium]|nr:APC family permease [Bacteroidales bacterium]